MERYKQARNVAILGIIANLFLFTIKIFLALISKSQGMLADSMMSITDVFSSLLTYIGNKLAQKPKDKEHPYGHGKVEYVFTLIISICMLLLAVSILYNSSMALINRDVIVFSWNLIMVCIVTIIIKILLYVYTSRLAKKYNSIIIKANAEDHRNDVFLTLGSLCGILASSFYIFFLDGIAGITIGLWIIYVSAKLFKGAYDVLIDTDIKEELKIEIRERIDNDIIIKNIEARPTGIGYILVITIKVNDRLMIKEVENIIEKITVNLSSIEEINEIIVKIR